MAIIAPASVYKFSLMNFGSGYGFSLTKLMSTGVLKPIRVSLLRSRSPEGLIAIASLDRMTGVSCKAGLSIKWLAALARCMKFTRLSVMIPFSLTGEGFRRCRVDLDGNGMLILSQPH